MELEEFRVYQEFMKMGEKIRNVVLAWGLFEKKTIGEQFVRAADSVASNLSERINMEETQGTS
ncbi:MAG: four helix bundle protein [Chlorobi bacterium]|nr:four helix bundle protein [Chlorobiota bacterium]